MHDYRTYVRTLMYMVSFSDASNSYTWVSTDVTSKTMISVTEVYTYGINKVQIKYFFISAKLLLF